MKSIYIIGSLRNPNVPVIGQRLRQEGFDVFDDWHSCGPEADDKWKEYEQARGRSYAEALEGYAATHVFDFDHSHLKRCDVALLVCPAGKSGHMELGWMLGQGKPGFILHDDPARWDVMYKFATAVFFNEEDLIKRLRKEPFYETKAHVVRTVKSS